VKNSLELRKIMGKILETLGEIRNSTKYIIGFMKILMKSYVAQIRIRVSDTIRIGYADTQFAKKNSDTGIRLVYL
jgi:hypothetical protein